MDELSNIELTVLFWDIETTSNKWVYATRAAEPIAGFLSSEGISKSVYLLWSGEGRNIRLWLPVSNHVFLCHVELLDMFISISVNAIRIVGLNPMNSEGDEHLNEPRLPEGSCRDSRRVVGAKKP